MWNVILKDFYYYLLIGVAFLIVVLFIYLILKNTKQETSLSFIKNPFLVVLFILTWPYVLHLLFSKSARERLEKKVRKTKNP